MLIAVLVLVIVLQSIGLLICRYRMTRPPKFDGTLLVRDVDGVPAYSFEIEDVDDLVVTRDEFRLQVLKPAPEVGPRA